MTKASLDETKCEEICSASLLNERVRANRLVRTSHPKSIDGRLESANWSLSLALTSSLIMVSMLFPIMVTVTRREVYSLAKILKDIVYEASKNKPLFTSVQLGCNSRIFNGRSSQRRKRVTL